MEPLKERYYQELYNAQLNFKEGIKKIYPIIYMINVSTHSIHGKDDAIIAYFTDENKAKSLIGTGRWFCYDQCNDGSESFEFNIISTTNYDQLDFQLLMNINKNINMSYYGVMQK